VRRSSFLLLTLEVLAIAVFLAITIGVTVLVAKVMPTPAAESPADCPGGSGAAPKGRAPPSPAAALRRAGQSS
jgi:hypothetical protein